MRHLRLLRSLAIVAACTGVFAGAWALAEEPAPPAAAEAADGWIHDDIDAAYAVARTSGKPLLVAFR